MGDAGFELGTSIIRSHKLVYFQWIVSQNDGDMAAYRILLSADRQITDMGPQGAQCCTVLCSVQYYLADKHSISMVSSADCQIFL